MTLARPSHRWLRDQLRGHVIAVEARSLDEQANTTKRAALADLETKLP